MYRLGQTLWIEKTSTRGALALVLDYPGKAFLIKLMLLNQVFVPFLGRRLWLTVFLHGLLARQDDQKFTFRLPSGPGRPWGCSGRPQLLCTGIRNGDGRGAPVYVKRVLEAGLLIKHRCLSKCSSERPWGWIGRL